MDNTQALKAAQQTLAHLGGQLNTIKNTDPSVADSVQRLLIQLRDVNTGIKNIMMGNDGGSFNFDSMSESMQRPQARQREATSSSMGGIDLSGFTEAVSEEDADDGADAWKEALKEGPDGVDIKTGVDYEQAPMEHLHIVDDTPAPQRHRF